MIRGLDSSIARPTPAQARAARAAGVRVWGGYLVSDSDADVLAARAQNRGLLGLAAPWTIAEFNDVLDAGLRAIGFCSGNDDPAAVGAKARANGILACLDDEDGIRAVAGGWQQGWLDDARAGHYGNVSTDVQVTTAPFHIIAEYPGADPGAVWPAHWLRPPGPVGWQWQGSHQEFGITVDSSWLDDWFGGADMTDAQAAQLQAIYDNLLTTPAKRTGGSAGDLIANLYQQLEDAAGAAVPAGGGPLVAILTQLAAVKAELDAIKALLPPATLAAHTHAGGQTGPAVPS